MGASSTLPMPYNTHIIKRFIKRVTFRANGMKSYSVVTMIDAKNEWASRIAKGATVTGYNTDKTVSYTHLRAHET